MDFLDQLISFVPAVFGALLSIYNWYNSVKPAKILPNEFAEYGVISSDYQEQILLCLPLIFHNNGAKKGMIRKVKVGFKQGEAIRYVEILGKVKLNELSGDEDQLLDWDRFQEIGYQYVRPTYPVVVEAGLSEDAVFMATAYHEDNIVPIDKKTTCVIEVYYKKKKKTVEFPFLLRSEDLGEDDYLWWLRPLPEEDTISNKDEEEKE